MAVTVVTDAAALAPENTLAAFDAGRRAGADGLHVDLRLTADRHVVALRDETVDATTDGSGAVGELDLADLRTLDAGSWFAPEHAGARVPTLDEVLRLAAAHGLELVLRLRGPWIGLEAALVTGPVLDAGLGGRTTVLSDDPQTLEPSRPPSPASRSPSSCTAATRRSCPAAGTWVPGRRRCRGGSSCSIRGSSTDYTTPASACWAGRWTSRSCGPAPRRSAWTRSSPTARNGSARGWADVSRRSWPSRACGPARTRSAGWARSAGRRP